MALIDPGRAGLPRGVINTRSSAQNLSTRPLTPHVQLVCLERIKTILEIDLEMLCSVAPTFAGRITGWHVLAICWIELGVH